MRAERQEINYILSLIKFNYLYFGMMMKPQPPQELFEPFQLRTYQVFKMIGKGEFGKVYLAYDKNKFEVAIKQTHASLRCVQISKSELKMSKKRQELFETQRTILHRVKNENVVRMYESFETPQNHYLVMEYCKEGDLSDFIKAKANGTLTEEEAIGFLIQLLNGFKGLHENLIIHRDIKLKNILVTENKIIKIADFGLSKISQEGIAKTIVGTAYTKAPEVFKGKFYDNKADIWSLGVIFYQMLFKLKYPFKPKISSEKALFELILSGKGPDFNPEGITISKDTQDLIQRMLTINPHQRIKWKEISDHPCIKKHLSKTGKASESSRVVNAEYYEKIQMYMDKYNNLCNKIAAHYEVLEFMEQTLERHVSLQRINTIYYTYLLCKKMKFYFSQIRESVDMCLEVSSIQQALNEQELRQQEDEINHYYEQAIYNLEVYRLAKSEGKVPGDMEKEVLKAAEQGVPEEIFIRYSLRFYKLLESKLEVLQQPVFQRPILRLMNLILVSIINQNADYDQTIESLHVSNKILLEKCEQYASRFQQPA